MQKYPKAAELAACHPQGKESTLGVVEAKNYLEVNIGIIKINASGLNEDLRALKVLLDGNTALNGEYMFNVQRHKRLQPLGPEMYYHWEYTVEVTYDKKVLESTELDFEM